MKKFSIITLGCKINQYESACVADSLLQDGYVYSDNDADVYIVNTCTVTGRTDFKSRNAVRKALEAKKAKPDALVIVTGCYAQREREKLVTLGAIDYIVDNQNKTKIGQILKGKNIPFEDIMEARRFSEYNTGGMLEKTRAFLKIQDGCDYYCSYCAVPYARGHARSRSFDNTIEQVNILVDKGYKEIVLSGINLGLYGQDNNTSLPILLTALEKIDGLKKIRLSSIEPQLFSKELCKAIQDSAKICPHFHIPLQSGSDTLLKAMGRHYETAKFAELLLNLQEIKPNCALGVDLICGLPGETEEIFGETVAFINSLPLTYLHVFSYSKRQKTKASLMENQVLNSVKKTRAAILGEISRKKTQNYIRQSLANNVEFSGIIEDVQGNYATCLSDHYLRVYCARTDLQKREIYKFRLVSPIFDGVLGELVENAGDKFA